MSSPASTARRVIAMAHALDVARSAAWYGGLGLTVRNSLTADDGALRWARLESDDGAALMLARASGRVDPEQQAVLFYVYVDDVAATHAALAAAGYAPGPVATPFYAPAGEFRLTDPDGYGVMVMRV